MILSHASRHRVIHFIRIMLAVVVMSVALASTAPPPHIVFFMADDVGRANLGFTRTEPATETRTPTIDALAANGLRLDRLYSYMFCSPTRSAFLSGRLPLHVNTLNLDPSVWNATSGEGAGIGTSMTTVASQLRRAGYVTGMFGKWCVIQSKSSSP